MPIDLGGFSVDEYLQRRPGEAPPVQPAPSTDPNRPRRPPDTRSFADRYSSAALAGMTAAAPAALAAGGIASVVGTPIAGGATAAMLAGGGALGGVIEQGVRDIAPEWSEDNPWLAPALGIAGSGFVGGAARIPGYVMQHGPGLARAAGMAALAHGAGFIDLAKHAVTFGTGLTAGTTLYGLGRALGDPARAAATYVAAPVGALMERGRNYLMQPAPPPPPAAEADIPLRPWKQYPGTRLEVDPNAAGQ